MTATPKDSELEVAEGYIRRADKSLDDPSHEVRSKAAVREAPELETDGDAKKKPAKKAAAKK